MLEVLSNYWLWMVAALIIALLMAVRGRRRENMSRFWIGFWLFVTPFLLVALLIATWPILSVDGKTLTQTGELKQFLGGNLEIRLLVMVALAGALGSAIQAAKSFASHVGKDDFKENWIPWYFLRFPVGVGLALLTYLVVRGGFLTGSFDVGTDVAKTINPFGVAAVAALTGMFAREASNKLSDIFGRLFSSEEAGADKALTLTSVTATETGTAPDIKVEFAIEGDGFVKGAKLAIGKKEFDTTFADSTQLTATIDQKHRGTGKKAKVKNPDGAESEEVEIG